MKMRSISLVQSLVLCKQERQVGVCRRMGRRQVPCQSQRISLLGVATTNEKVAPKIIFNAE